MTSVQIALAAAGAAAVAGATIAAALTKSAIDSAESTGILAGKLGITAEVERLRAELADLQDGYSRLSRDFALAIESDSKHIAELAECREDAERWRYLRDDGCGFEITVREENEDGYESWVSGYPGAELDAAIDAARKGEGE